MMTTFEFFVKASLTTALLLLGYLVCLYTYRIFLHPLSVFPGPKLAAATRWYEFYYEVILKGQYTFHIQQLHKKYGPIIRVAPDELHIDDPEFFDTLYVKIGKTDRFDFNNNRFGNASSVFTTGPDALHKVRRAPLTPFFSKRSIIQFENVLREKVGQLVEKFASYSASQQPIVVQHAYVALAADMMMEYCFGINDNHVGSPDFQDNFLAPFQAAAQAGHIAVQFPWVPKVMQKLPDSIVLNIEPLYILLFKLQRDLRSQVQIIKQAVANGKTDYARPNIFMELINSDLPPEEKTDTRLQDEAQTLVGAGVVSTGWTLAVATFHITRNPAIFKQLRKELEVALPSSSAPLEWSTLEQLPYLTACLKEALRLSYGVTGRTPRLAPREIQYKHWTIPARTPVGMTIVDVHHNEEIFPDSHSYKPERWLNSPKTRSEESLDRYLVSFLKGNRMCLGINFAWAELYLTLAGVFRNFEFELYETDESDVALKHDFTIPIPKLESKGIRVTVKSSLIEPESHQHPAVNSKSSGYEG